MPTNLKSENNLLKNKKIDKSISIKKNEKFPSLKKKQNAFKEQKSYSVINKSKIKNFYSNDANKINNLTKTMSLSKNNYKEMRDKSNLYKLMIHTENNIIPEGKNEKFLIPEKKLGSTNRNENNSVTTSQINTTYISNNTGHFFSSYNLNKNTNIMGNKSPESKYFSTTNNFTSSLNKNYKNNNINSLNNYNFKTNTSKFYTPTKPLKIKSRNYKLLTKSYNSHNESNSDSFNERKKKLKNLYKKEKLPRINLTYWELREIENTLNAEYNNNFKDVSKNNKKIKKIKEKCKYILKELDKKNNYEIEQIMKDIQDQLLSLGFNDFYRYLLTILKNYDKKIVDWAFDVVEEKKECPEELKLKNVRIKHQKFMDILNNQFILGINTNKYMDNLIKNSKNVLGFNNKNKYNNKINFNNTHTNINRNNYLDIILNNSKYKSKFFDTNNQK